MCDERNGNEAPERLDSYIDVLRYIVKMAHDEMRSRVCFACFERVNERAKENLVSQPSLQERVKRLFPKVLANDSFPIGVCSGCKTKIYEFDRGLRNSFDLSKFDEFAAKYARSSPRAKCTCIICEIGGKPPIKAVGADKRGRPTQRFYLSCFLRNR